VTGRAFSPQKNAHHLSLKVLFLNNCRKKTEGDHYKGDGNHQHEIKTSALTLWAIKRSQLIFACNFVKNQHILMQFALLDFKMNGTCDDMNFAHLT